MGQVGPGVAGALMAAFAASQVEVLVLVVAAVLLVGLLVVKFLFSRDLRFRKAASSGYHQRDVARYTQVGVDIPDAVAADPRTIPLAPTFMAPSRRGAERDRAARRKVTASTVTWPSSSGRSRRRQSSAPYGTVDPLSGLPPAFDADQAERLRPAAGSRSASFGPLPKEVPMLDVEVEVDPDEIPPPAGALPLLSQPPPPPPESKPTAVG